MYFSNRIEFRITVAYCFVHPGVDIPYTRVYEPCTPGCTKPVHPGVQNNMQ